MMTASKNFATTNATVALSQKKRKSRDRNQKQLSTDKIIYTVSSKRVIFSINTLKTDDEPIFFSCNLGHA